VVFCVSRSGEAHALFVLAAIEGQVVADGIERLAQARHVAMAEDAEAAAADAGFHPIDFYELVHQKADDGLCDGQPEAGL
jgi:hypothetical protein